jgi:F-type H+-transporting ATPase subunit b
MLEVNGTLLILVVSFLAFIYLLDKVFVSPVSRVLEVRAKKIQDDLDASKKARVEAEEILAQYQKHLAEVRDKAQATISDAVAAAQKTRSEELGKIMEQGREKLTAAKLTLQAEKQQLVDQLVDEQVKLVQTIIAKLVGVGGGNHSLDRERVKRSLEEAC